MTIKLSNRIICDDGSVICSQSALTELLYTGGDLSGIFCDDQDDETEWLNGHRVCDDFSDGPQYVSTGQYADINWYEHWFTPEPYKSMDIERWCYEKCNSDLERERVLHELAEMKNRSMYSIIRHLIYCVDVWRTNGIFWGVGRGSSVCSFVLYLIGINRVNPLEYGLELREWLKN